MSKPPQIAFNLPALTGREVEYLQEVLNSRHLSGDGKFTKQCHAWLEKTLCAKKALLTHSATAALEMSAMLANLEPGDEVVMPSFTFVSTANAVVARGAVPVFIDVREDTLNIDEKLIEAAITPKTKAIFVVHYAGVGAEMDTILAIAKKHRLMVLEDAAQVLLATYKGRALGTIGALGALSFHETKNAVSGEGGALLINDEELYLRAEIIREKGTNRSQFFRGMVDKYTWVDIGSSYLPSDLIAAVLFAQLGSARDFNENRKATWTKYHEAFADLEAKGRLRRPCVPAECEHNGHMYYLLAGSLEERTALISFLRERAISAPFHYVPLHSAPAGKKFARVHGSLSNTEMASDRLVRMPLWPGLSDQDVARVTETIYEFYAKANR